VIKKVVIFVYKNSFIQECKRQRECWNYRVVCWRNGIQWVSSEAWKVHTHTLHSRSPT